jgi:Myotubularin-like phosphatase domain
VLIIFVISEKNLYVLDCRPKANAMGNRAKGAGYEDTSTSYPNCILEFLNIGMAKQK